MRRVSAAAAAAAMCEADRVRCSFLLSSCMSCVQTKEQRKVAKSLPATLDQKSWRRTFVQLKNIMTFFIFLTTDDGQNKRPKEKFSIDGTALLRTTLKFKNGQFKHSLNPTHYIMTHYTPMNCCPGLRLRHWLWDISQKEPSSPQITQYSIRFGS